MKKYFSLLAFSFFLMTGISAQITLGIKASRNHAWQKYADDFFLQDVDLGIRGYGGALAAKYHLGNYFALAAEPGIARRGSKCEPGFILPYGGEDAKLVCTYVEMPLMAEGSVGFFQNKLKVFGKAGAGAAYLAGGYREISFQSPEIPAERNKLDMAAETNLNRWDYGLYGGGGLAVKAGPGYFTMEYRYYRAFPDVNKSIRSKNRDTNFSVGYQLPVF